MLGAIAGDIIGSIYEADPIKTTDFPLFGDGCRVTDDTVLTLAVADALLDGAGSGDLTTLYIDSFHEWFADYPYAGFGQTFFQWAAGRMREPYGSFGNGSAMRVSPVAYAFDTLDDVVAEARRSAVVTHNHSEGIRGAQAVAAAIFLARTGKSKPDIREYIEQTFQYFLDYPLDQLRRHYTFDVSCQGSVPEALIAFLESSSYEDAVRNAVSLGGDSDTQACIAGGIAEAFYGGVPEPIAAQAMERLDSRMRNVVEVFYATFDIARVAPQ